LGSHEEVSTNKDTAHSLNVIKKERGRSIRFIFGLTGQHLDVPKKGVGFYNLVGPSSFSQQVKQKDGQQDFTIQMCGAAKFTDTLYNYVK
jgi:hypothetical protein